MLLAKDGNTITHYCDSCKEFVDASILNNSHCKVCNNRLSIGSENGLRSWFDIPKHKKPKTLFPNVSKKIDDKHIQTLIDAAREYSSFVDHVFMGDSAPKAKKIKDNIRIAIERIEPFLK